MEFTKNGIRISTLKVGPLRTNCYIISLMDSKESFMIDPGGGEEVISNQCRKMQYEVKGILLTHGHYDHILAVDSLKRKVRADVFVYEKEKELIKNKDLNCSRITGCHYECTPDVYLKDNQMISLAGVNVRVLYTPGHTTGSCCFLLKDYGVLFSGDTLFKESIGRTDLPTGDMKQILSSVRDKLLVLDESTDVFPGHGEKTTIGYENRYNPYGNKVDLWDM